MLALLVSGVGAMGCETRPVINESGPADEALWKTEAWPYRPASIRLHPLSRLVHTTSGDVLEIRIECLDDEHDSTRTIGVLSVQVKGDEGAEPQKWNLSDPRVNRACWDVVTRTYTVRVPLPAGFICEPNLKIDVNVQVRTGTETVLSDRGQVVCP